MTRLWFLLSIGGEPKDPTAWTRGVIIDAQELVKSEIWSITTRDSSYSPPKLETFYVLESTCEVVGHPPSISDSETSATSRSIPVRADWSAYIAHRLLPPSMHDSPPPSLIQHLKGTNYEEFDKGISKQWLHRIANEGEIGIAKRTVAERYVLACVFGNRSIVLFRICSIY